MNRRVLAVWSCLALWCVGAQAEVRLPRVFSAHAVLQRDREVPVWGWAAAGEAVTIQLDEQAAVKTTAGADGIWKAALPAQPAGGPHKLTVSGSNQIVLDDLLFGEVWLCSGQSNMEMVVASCANAADDIAKSEDPLLRHFLVDKRPAPLPIDDVKGSWQLASPATVGRFTACGYFMARELRKVLGVPVGLLHSSWGGTCIETWVPPVGFAAVPSLASHSQRVALSDPHTDAYKGRLKQHLADLDAWAGKAREALPAEQLVQPNPPFPPELIPLDRRESPQQQPTSLYNGMVRGLVPYGLRGAIWYQGESNHGETVSYTDKMKALIGGWRQLFGQGDFPFLYVQIAPYHYGNEPPAILPQFWEAQAAALSIPNTGMVVTNDIGDYKDIHPKNKQEVGRRLALLALKGTYGKADVVADGPVFKSFKIDGDKLRVSFDNVGGGLAARDDKPLDGFEIIGVDTDFMPADAVVDGATVVLSAAGCKEPRAVRFGWNKAANPNLQNKEGLPARAFRAGEVPRRDWLALKVPEAKDYTLVYDLDLANASRNPKYTVDDHDKVTGPIDRIAYFLELQKEGQPAQYAYVSMDAFTQELGKIGLPTPESAAIWQTKVTNLTVICNVDGVKTGTGLNGNIEMWPHNYGTPNAAKIPGATDNLYDFGDQYVDPVDGYGCLQVHNYEARQTILAVNHWVAGGGADLGIGNSPGPQPDWTFSANAASYSAKRLRVLVHKK